MATQPLPRIQRDVIREILRQLRAAESAILASIRGATDADRARRLARQRAEIQRSIEVFRAAASAAATGGLDAAWEAAAAVIRQQAGAAASGVAIGSRIDARVLLAMRNFMTNRIADISRVAIDKINTALAQHLLGVQSLADLVTQVQRILGGEPRRRAMTIAYTEIGRAYSSAQYAQMLEQAKVLPGLKKRWIHSGKEHGRPGHILCADATLADPIPVAEPFEIVNLKTGEVEELRYPRDPEASAGNTINCGCMMVAVPPEDDVYVPLREEDIVRAPGAAPMQLRIEQSVDGLLAAIALRGLIERFAARAMARNAVKQDLIVISDIPAPFGVLLGRIGQATEGRRLALDHDNTRHLLTAHGQARERLRGQEPITATDLARLPEILAAASSVVPGSPPTARDGAPLVEAHASVGDFDYTVVMKMRRREMVPYTMHKRPRKK